MEIGSLGMQVQLVPVPENRRNAGVGLVDAGVEATASTKPTPVAPHGRVVWQSADTNSAELHATLPIGLMSTS